LPPAEPAPVSSCGIKLRRGPDATALTLALTFSAATDANADGILDTAGGKGLGARAQRARARAADHLFIAASDDPRALQELAETISTCQ
jgi:hypothetical protein